MQNKQEKITKNFVKKSIIFIDINDLKIFIMI